jgi:tRNA-Thr(GGU) m(6)t(6)A37 methyltransferase TsaA
MIIDGNGLGEFMSAGENKAMIEFVPIGFVESPFKEIQRDPDVFKGRESSIRVLEPYVEGLFRLEQYDRLYVIYVFDRAEGFRLVIHPRGDVTRPQRGVFATHSPYRPNPLGLAVVELVSVQGDLVTVRDLDAIDGTPVLDIKPCEDNVVY